MYLYLCCRIQIYEYCCTQNSNNSIPSLHKNKQNYPQIELLLDVMAILSIFMAQIIEISPQKSSYRTMSRHRSRMSRTRSFSARRFPLPSRPPQTPLRTLARLLSLQLICIYNLDQPIFSLKKRLYEAGDMTKYISYQRLKYYI